MVGQHRRRGDDSGSDADARPAKRPCAARAARAKKPGAFAPFEAFEAARALLCSSSMSSHAHANTNVFRRHVAAAVERAGACTSALRRLPRSSKELNAVCEIIAAHARETTGLQRVHVQRQLPCACAGECRWRLCAEPPKPTAQLVRGRAGRDGHASGVSASAADLPLRLLGRIMRAVGPRRRTLELLTQTAQALRAAALGELPQMFVDYALGPRQLSHPLADGVRHGNRSHPLQKSLVERLLERPLACIRALNSNAAVRLTDEHLHHHQPLIRRVPYEWRALANGPPSLTTLAMLGRAQARVQALVGGGDNIVYSVRPATLNSLLFQLERIDGDAQARIREVIDGCARSHPIVYTARRRADLVHQANSAILCSTDRGCNVPERVLCELARHLGTVNAAIDRLVRTHLVPLDAIDKPETLCPFVWDPRSDGSSVELAVEKRYVERIQPFVYRRPTALFDAVRTAAGERWDAVVRVFESAEGSFGGRALLRGMAAQLAECKFDPRIVRLLLPAFEAALRAVP